MTVLSFLNSDLMKHKNQHDPDHCPGSYTQTSQLLPLLNFMLFSDHCPIVNVVRWGDSQPDNTYCLPALSMLLLKKQASRLRRNV